MPRYFFNAFGVKRARDLTGTELPDIRAAWQKATTECGELIKEIDGDLAPGRGLRLEVADEFANPIYTIQIEVRSHR